MNSCFRNSRRWWVGFCFAALALGPSLVGQDAHLFRISGPAATRLLTLNLDGTVVWTNAQPGADYQFQTSTTLGGVSNWVDYARVTSTAGVSSNRLFDLHPRRTWR